MNLRLFGFRIVSDEKKEERKVVSFVPPANDDGAQMVAGTGAYWGHYVDINGDASRNEADQIKKYRQAAQQPECDSAIEDIINEAIVADEVEKPVEIHLDDLDQPDEIKEMVRKEFDRVLELLDFSFSGHDIFRKWYVDGRIYYHIVLDRDNPQVGIAELRPIDAMYIRKVCEFEKEIDKATGQAMVKSGEEYFLYNDTGLQGGNVGLRIAPDSIVYVPSGILDDTRKRVSGYLQKALKSVNQLRMMEDSLVIYRVSRAPERRVFYVDVGNLPRAKAEEYLKGVMDKYRNKLVYDAQSGEIRDDRKHMSILEDFWLPRREGGRSTEVDTLPGGCLAMDTKVSLLDGRELSITEIASELETGRRLWTYSCDEKTGGIKPGLISWAGVTQESAQVIELTLDNGEKIICTPDHKFPIYGKGFIEAKDLKIDESLIPLYRKKEKISVYTEAKRDYEQIFDNEQKKWIYTHRMIRDTGMLDEYTYKDCHRDEKKNVCHHVDFDRFNNSPDNLVMMSWNDHRRLHQDLAKFPAWAAKAGADAAAAKLKFIKENDPPRYAQIIEKHRQRHLALWRDPEFREKCLRSFAIYWDNLSAKEISIRASISSKNAAKGTASLKRKLLDPKYNSWYCNRLRTGWSADKRKSASRRCTKQNLKAWSNPVLASKRLEQHRKIQKLDFDTSIISAMVDVIKNKTSHQVNLEDVAESLNSNRGILETFVALNKQKRIPNLDVSEGFTSQTIKKAVAWAGYSGWSDFRKKNGLFNHRVVSIRYLPEKIRVGTLTIDQAEEFHSHHTFALSCGVFTKNSNLGQIDDIVFFQKKLYRSLNIPVSRLETDTGFNLGKSSEITRDEIKFQKFIDRIRKQFSQLFLDLLRVQLIAKSIITADDWTEFRENIRIDFRRDNHFSELKDSEILAGRLALLQQIVPFTGPGSYYSMDWVRKNVLRLTDEDVRNMNGKMDMNQIAAVIDAGKSDDRPAVGQVVGKIVDTGSGVSGVVDTASIRDITEV